MKLVSNVCLSSIYTTWDTTAWRDTCPELAVWIPGVAYSLAHVRGNHVYLGPSGVMRPPPPSSGAAGVDGGGGAIESNVNAKANAEDASVNASVVEEKVVLGFFEGVLSLASRVLANQAEGEGVDGIVVYVPESLRESLSEETTSDDEADDEAAARDSNSAAARAVRGLLEEAGFELQETTVRMARPPPDDAAAADGECVLRDDEEGKDRLYTPPQLRALTRLFYRSPPIKNTYTYFPQCKPEVEQRIRVV